MACDYWIETEDGRPGMGARIVEVHSGTAREYVLWWCPVRKLPHHLRGRKLALRAYTVSGEVTVSIEGVRTE